MERTNYAKHIDAAIKLPPSDDVIQKRLDISNALENHEDNLISIIGPCPLVDEYEIIHNEAVTKAEIDDKLSNLLSLDRQCFTKPRTNPEDWQGLDSSDRPAAHRILHKLSNEFANVTAEIRTLENLELYAAKLSFVWTGGRNVGNTELVQLLASYDKTLPIGVKNGLDGDIEPALDQIRAINDIRQGDGAPAVLIYRGGSNAITPRQSDDAYKRAHEKTDGKIIRDNAHGTEMAYNPGQEFEKSIEGQVLASEAIIKLARQGFAPAGVMNEASELESIMDPHMSLETAIHYVKQLYAAKLGRLTVGAAVAA